MPSFSDYIVYVDESGDHSLSSVDVGYPVFVLAFCLFEKERYASHCAPAMIRFKFEHMGHDQAVLHEREIRKRLAPFSFLNNADLNRGFLADLTELITDAPLTLVAVVIDKAALNAADAEADNPYHIALGLGMEQIHRHLARTIGCEGGTLQVVFEKRGRTEDRELELEFRRLCGAPGTNRPRYPFGFVVADKKGNSTGLQLADLVARPIGLRVFRPDQRNRTWEILRPKLLSDPDGRVEGKGLLVFPKADHTP